MSQSDRAVTFFTLLLDYHSSLFCKESVISVFYARIPQSFDQNTKQALVQGYAAKIKKILAFSQTSLSLFLFKKCFRRLLKSGVTRIELKDSDFSCGKKSGSMFFNDAMGEIESHIDISHTKRLSTAVYSFLSQTGQTQNLVLTRAACIYLCFSPLLVSSLKQSVFIFERVTSKKTKFIVIVIIFLLRKNILLV